MQCEPRNSTYDSSQATSGLYRRNTHSQMDLSLSISLEYWQFSLPERRLRTTLYKQEIMDPAK